MSGIGRRLEGTEDLYKGGGRGFQAAAGDLEKQWLSSLCLLIVVKWGTNSWRRSCSPDRLGELGTHRMFLDGAEGGFARGSAVGR